MHLTWYQVALILAVQATGSWLFCRKVDAHIRDLEKYFKEPPFSGQTHALKVNGSKEQR